jgi:hypothetical protein
MEASSLSNRCSWIMRSSLSEERNQSIKSHDDAQFAKGQKEEADSAPCQCLTANAVAHQRVAEQGALIFGTPTSRGGEAITHKVDTAAFSLTGGHTYLVEAWISTKTLCRLDLSAEVRLNGEAVNWLRSAGGAYAAAGYIYITAPKAGGVLEIINTSGEELEGVNASIHIAKIS